MPAMQSKSSTTSEYLRQDLETHMPYIMPKSDAIAPVLDLVSVGLMPSTCFVCCLTKTGLDASLVWEANLAWRLTSG